MYISVVRIELFGRRGVPIRGGLLQISNNELNHKNAFKIDVQMYQSFDALFMQQS